MCAHSEIPLLFLFSSSLTFSFLCLIFNSLLLLYISISIINLSSLSSSQLLQFSPPVSLFYHLPLSFTISSFSFSSSLSLLHSYFMCTLVYIYLPLLIYHNSSMVSLIFSFSLFSFLFSSIFISLSLLFSLWFLWPDPQASKHETLRPSNLISTTPYFTSTLLHKIFTTHKSLCSLSLFCFGIPYIYNLRISSISISVSFTLLHYIFVIVCFCIVMVDQKFRPYTYYICCFCLVQYN